MNYQQLLQYGRKIFREIFYKFPQNIPKCTIPIICGIPILYYVTKKWRSSVIIEDNYQRIINEKNNTTQSVIDCIAFYDSDSINTINYEIMCNKLIRFNENYNKISANKINDIHLFNTKKEFLNCKQYHYKIWVDIENRRIYGKFNHDLIGASNISKFFYTAFAHGQIKRLSLFNLLSWDFPTEQIKRLGLFNLLSWDFPIQQKDNFYHIRFYHIFSAIKLILLRNNIPKIKNPLPLFKNSINIRRYLARQTFQRKNNVKATIIYHIMLRLYYSLGIKSQRRDLVCYLPITFYNIKNINNNIGIMWLTFNEADTVVSIKRKMEKNAYQIFGSNFLLSNGLLSMKSCSKNTRKNADAIITILFTEDPNNIKFSWTYPSIADYPVYVAVHSCLTENTVHLMQTYTVNTPNFEPGELQQVEENYLFESI
jgi:hypothetical protein